MIFGTLWKYVRFSLPFLLGWVAVHALWVGPSVTMTGLLLGLTVVLALEWGTQGKGSIRQNTPIPACSCG